MRVVRASSLVFLLALFPLVSEAAAPAGEGLPSRDIKSPPRQSGLILYRYKIDTFRSRISFTFRGLMLPYDGHFGVLEGEIFLGPGGKFRGAKADIVVHSASVKTKDPGILANLRGQVLEVRRFPRIRLKVDSAKSDGEPVRQRREREWKVKARGKLLLHGVEREVPLRFRLTDTGAEIYVRGEGPLSLSRYNMSPPSVLLFVPGSDRVTVRVRLVAKPAPR